MGEPKRITLQEFADLARRDLKTMRNYSYDYREGGAKAGGLVPVFPTRDQPRNGTYDRREALAWIRAKNAADYAARGNAGRPVGAQAGKPCERCGTVVPKRWRGKVTRMLLCKADKAAEFRDDFDPEVARAEAAETAERLGEA